MVFHFYSLLEQLGLFSTYHPQGRGGKGSIFVWAAGNGGFNYDSCAADGYVQSIYTIPIGALNSTGSPAGYDERCSAKMASTFVTHTSTFSIVSPTGPFISHQIITCFFARVLPTLMDSVGKISTEPVQQLQKPLESLP